MISLVVRSPDAPRAGKRKYFSCYSFVESAPAGARRVACVIHSIVSPFRGIEIIQNDTKLCENGLAWEEGARLCAFVLNPTLGQTLDQRRRRATQRGAARGVRPISRCCSSAQRSRHSYLTWPRNIQISRLKSVSSRKCCPNRVQLLLVGKWNG